MSLHFHVAAGLGALSTEFIVRDRSHAEHELELARQAKSAAAQRMCLDPTCLGDEPQSSGAFEAWLKGRDDSGGIGGEGAVW